MPNEETLCNLFTPLVCFGTYMLAVGLIYTNVADTQADFIFSAQGTWWIRATFNLTKTGMFYIISGFPAAALIAAASCCEVFIVSFTVLLDSFSFAPSHSLTVSPVFLIT